MKDPLPCIALSVTPQIALYHRGPPLDMGPLPSVFYFALSGTDSLCLDPYNQPIEFLSGKMIRTFSLTLPAHEANLPPEGALTTWEEEFAKGLDCLEPFLDQIQTALHFAIQEKFVLPDKLAIAGLSRGGLIALFAAAREPLFRTILAFAPLTKLWLAKEFAPLEQHPLVRAYDAERIAENLADRRLRLYMGNRDQRVSTPACFSFAMSVVEKAYETKIRPAQVELILTPSIGHKGHGTSLETFQQGAKWLIDCLN